jgi:peptidoglycan hydrolase CwlO-like protein
LKSSQDKVEKLKGSVNDKSEKMTQLQQKITQLEVDVQGKVSLW